MMSESPIAGRIARLAGWRRAAVACLAGVLSVLAMAPFFLSPVLFLTLPVLVWLVDGTGPYPRAQSLPGLGSGRAALRAGVAGWWFGFGYFVCGLFWIGEAFLVEAETFAWLLPFAVTLLPAGLALFFALASAAARLAWHSGLARILVLAVALSLAEWLRGHIFTGFPWNTLGYALTAQLPLLQTAGIFGIYGLTLLTVLIFATPLVLWDEAQAHQRRKAVIAICLAAALPLAVLTGIGALQLMRQPIAIDDSARLRIVQPSIPQREKWQADKQAANFDLHLMLSRQDAAGRRDELAGISHVIWPEAAMPFLPLDRPEALAMIADLLPRGTHLLTGALRMERTVAGERRAYNSLIVFGQGGTLAGLYDKIHLVPFGEYLPFQTTLEAIGLQQLTRLRGGFSAGAAPRADLVIPGLPPVGALICYEAIFPTELVQGSQRPGVFVNLTNDGWFGNSIGPHQHLHQARVRAVEQGVPVIRAANNGISAVIDAQGRVLASLALDQRGVIDSRLPPAGAATPYARFGEWLFAALLLVALAVIVALRWQAGRSALVPDRGIECHTSWHENAA